MWLICGRWKGDHTESLLRSWLSYVSFSGALKVILYFDGIHIFHVKGPWNSLFVTHLLCHVVVFLAVKSRKTMTDTGKSQVFDTGGVGSGGRLSVLSPRPSADAGMGLGLKLWA